MILWRRRNNVDVVMLLWFKDVYDVYDVTMVLDVLMSDVKMLIWCKDVTKM